MSYQTQAVSRLQAQKQNGQCHFLLAKASPLGSFCRFLRSINRLNDGYIQSKITSRSQSIQNLCVVFSFKFQELIKDLRLLNLSSDNSSL